MLLGANYFRHAGNNGCENKKLHNQDKRKSASVFLSTAAAAFFSFLPTWCISTQVFCHTAVLCCSFQLTRQVHWFTLKKVKKKWTCFSNLSLVARATGFPFNNVLKQYLETWAILWKHCILRQEYLIHHQMQENFHPSVSSQIPSGRKQRKF